MTAIPRQLCIAAFLACSPVVMMAQATWQPTPPPTVTAENEPWYIAGDPIVWSDAYYYRAGAPVFFNRYQMVRTGAYRGIPLYTDSTQDPGIGIIYVPIANGLLQPYERRRTGSLAGTTGNRAPSFPTSIAAEGIDDSPRAFTGLPGPSVSAPETAVGTTGRSIVEAPRTPAAEARPKGINGVWITYQGLRWFAAGKAIPLDARFSQAGSYHDFPVYRRPQDPETIYVPTSNGMVAPYGARPK
jgi:hypothetical protein